MAVAEQDQERLESILRTLRDPITDEDKRSALEKAYELGKGATAGANMRTLKRTTKKGKSA